MPYYKSGRTILERHGLFTWALYWTTDGISHLTISHYLRALPEKRLFHFARDPQLEKPLPWWQDIATLAPAILLSAIAIPSAWSEKCVMQWIGFGFALWAVVDSVNYLLRVLWFDDLTPRFTQARKAVWSHGRILFVALLSYVQSIALFPVFYHRMTEHSAMTYPQLLERSLLTATLLEAAKPLRLATASQVTISLFLLTVAIAVIAAICYKREELADKKK